MAKSVGTTREATRHIGVALPQKLWLAVRYQSVLDDQTTSALVITHLTTAIRPEVWAALDGQDE